MLIYICIALLIGVVLIAGTSRNKWWNTLRHTYRRDITASYRFFRFSLLLRSLMRSETTAAKAFERLVRKHPEKVAFHFEDRTWTYRQLDEFSNKVARVFRDAGYAKGDVIALFMSSCPEYVAIWLGLSKIGVVTALINTNLTKASFLHTVSTAKSKALIRSHEFQNVVADVERELAEQNVQIYDIFNEGEECVKTHLDLSALIAKEDAHFPLAEWTDVKLSDNLMYIYTSGTTGLPKAAVITNIRFILLACAFKCMTGLWESDIIYVALPLYHTAGGLLGVSQCIVHGYTVVLRRKFSARAFWTDCEKYNCTVAQYIGEICRYLLAVPENNNQVGNENKTVRMLVGNGLKPQIWQRFVDRFRIANICEVYGSTEGNSNLVNFDNRVGAVGFSPQLLPRCLQPITSMLVRSSSDGTPIRNERGNCIRCGINEPGVFIAKINQKNILNAFVGYADKTATKNKILRNVFEPDDVYFNSGDLLIQDELGYYYFKDRTGDTFRWKGENVSTNEVEAVISNILHLNDAVVYGVEIPAMDGRAGMAAIVDPEHQLDLEYFSRELVNNLPGYAVPIFLRIMPKLALTGTFKLKKVDLQNEAFDIAKIKDKLFIFDFAQSKYVPLTTQLYDDLITGKVRL